jgi:hypothetical protein
VGHGAAVMLRTKPKPKPRRSECRRHLQLQHRCCIYDGSHTDLMADAYDDSDDGGNFRLEIFRVGVWGLGFRVWGLGFGVWGLGLGV